MTLAAIHRQSGRQVNHGGDKHTVVGLHGVRDSQCFEPTVEEITIASRWKQSPWFSPRRDHRDSTVIGKNYIFHGKMFAFSLRTIRFLRFAKNLKFNFWTQKLGFQSFETQRLKALNSLQTDKLRSERRKRSNTDQTLKSRPGATSCFVPFFVFADFQHERNWSPEELQSTTRVLNVRVVRTYRNARSHRAFYFLRGTRSRDVK